VSSIFKKKGDGVLRKGTVYLFSDRPAVAWAKELSFFLKRNM